MKEQQYRDRIKKGDYIRITLRKCGRLQPQIKENEIYLVEGTDSTKTGAQVLIIQELADPDKPVLKDVAPFGKTYRCNSDRFTWKRVVFGDLVKRKQEMDNKRQEARALMQKGYKEFCDKQQDRLKTDFSFDEQVRIAFIPLIMYYIAWDYALKTVDEAAKNKIQSVKKLSRVVRELRERYLRYLTMDLNKSHIEMVQEQTRGFMEEHEMDFLVMFHATFNSINKQHVGITYDELRTYAYLSMLFIKECRKHEDDMTQFISRRIGKTNAAHLPYQEELNKCMDAYLGDYRIVETQEIKNAMAIFKKNIDSIKYTLKKDN